LCTSQKEWERKMKREYDIERGKEGDKGKNVGF
jgi:hypothetical protein